MGFCGSCSFAFERQKIKTKFKENKKQFHLKRENFCEICFWHFFNLSFFPSWNSLQNLFLFFKNFFMLNFLTFFCNFFILVFYVKFGFKATEWTHNFPKITWNCRNLQSEKGTKWWRPMKEAGKEEATEEEEEEEEKHIKNCPNSLANINCIRSKTGIFFFIWTFFLFFYFFFFTFFVLIFLVHLNLAVFAFVFVFFFFCLVLF